jgi:hypothetical protein
LEIGLNPLAARSQYSTVGPFSAAAASKIDQRTDIILLARPSLLFLLALSHTYKKKMRSLTFFPLLGIQNIYLHYKEAALNSSRPAEQLGEERCAAACKYISTPTCSA